MYRKDSEGWLKHGDFIVLDMLCLQLAFILAYAFRGYGFNVYGDILYRNMAIFLGFADLVVIFTSGTMKSVLKRGHYKEFVTTLKNAVAVGALAIAYLFIIQEGQSFSRMILITTIVIYLILTYAIREIWKNSLHKKMENGGDKKLLIITSKAVAENVVHSMQENNYARYSLAGVVVIDEECTGEKICGVPVVAGESDVPMYVCQEWIDEVLIVISENLPYPDGLIDKLTETGVTVHLNLAKITNQTGKRQFVEKVGSYTVLTTSLNYASFGQLFLKRLMDICGGLVGCIFTGIITIFVGPAIYLASPGPIFFSQERVGKNGKKFKMYKFRSMYMDAEARKAELMKENKLGDGKMFKMDFDPRVIGNKVLPDGAHKTGVGDFIRKTSLDEFPQFFNVLKGDMSIVGTRPPLISETNLYEPRHKVRTTSSTYGDWYGVELSADNKKQFYIPSVREGFGMTGVEALASGVPVVGSDVQGIREYVIPGKTGYLCDPYDAHQFADAIEKIVNLPSEERAKMVIACKEKAKEFDISKSIAAMKNIYQEVLCHDGE